MTSLLRFLAALVLALCFALPGVSGEGGDNAGAGGVWVLPRAGAVGIGGIGGIAPRDTRTVGFASDVFLQMSHDVGVATATFVDSVSQVPTGLIVTGNLVRLPAALLQALAPFAGATATIVITDAAQVGYVIQLTVHANNTATLQAF
jgi:hypothetical protein